MNMKIEYWNPVPPGHFFMRPSISQREKNASKTMSSANQNLLAFLLVYRPYPGQHQNAIKQQIKLLMNILQFSLTWLEIKNQILVKYYHFSDL